MTEAESFDLQAKQVRVVAEQMLAEHFGERCPDFEPNCPICKRYQLLDSLLESPYQDDTND